MLGEQLSESSVELSLEEAAVIESLAYFDVFQYPLKPSEVHQFTKTPIARQNIVPTLNYLVNLGLIYKHGQYYSLVDDVALTTRREKGNDMAATMLKRARFFSHLISRFPFVRGVCISGSLSKGYIDELGDVDYFIITKPGRLWIARTLLIAFKKVFLLNSKKYFCVNYFVDTEHLEIPDKNIFTATEVMTLIPVYSMESHQAFVNSNKWAESYLPNFVSDKHDEPKWIIPRLLKPVVESLFSGFIGNGLDTFFMNMTIKRWERRFSHFSRQDFEHALRSRKYVSKHHPQNFQKVVLNALNNKIKDFESRHQCELSRVNG
ncbi:MAG: nucleotidyltransferase domain-containing protein [Flavobacteriales bacterium]